MQHDLKSILLAIPMFKTLDSDEINQVIKLMSVHEFADGESLLVEGAPSSRLIVILSGKVSVIKGKGDTASHLTDLDAGEIVGEVGVLENAPCSASVVARGAVEAGAITRDDLEKFFASNRLAANKVLRQMVLVLAGRLRRTNVSYSSLKTIADSFE
jgi:CRP-like cAMP-binding protein